MRLVFLLSLVVAFCAWAGTSERVSVCVDPSKSLVWRTVMGSEVTVSIDWPEAATSAHLEISDGIRVIRSLDLSDRTVVEQTIGLSRPANDADERLIDFSLTFRSESQTIVEERRARLGLVRGIAGELAAFRPYGDERMAWSRIRSRVVPMADGATGLTVDGKTITNTGSPGWAFLPELSAGSHTLACEFSDETWTASVCGFAGLMIIFR